MATWSLTVCFYMKIKTASVLFNPSKPPFYKSPLHVITEVVQPLCCHGIYTDRQSTTDALGVKNASRIQEITRLKFHHEIAVPVPIHFQFTHTQFHCSQSPSSVPSFLWLTDKLAGMFDCWMCYDHRVKRTILKPTWRSQIQHGVRDRGAGGRRLLFDYGAGRLFRSILQSAPAHFGRW